ncbi:MAG: glycosyltransferase family 4 protein [Chthoniobacterales bacterium]|nr:glycosyltransferase family 4 protein [Chthoniobacterales bacterium]
MPQTSPISKVAFLGDYPPRQCGIATFTRDLHDAIAAAHADWHCPVVAISDIAGAYQYPPEVRFEVPQADVASYLRAANFLNISHTDVLCLQHEFGIFGGPAGSHLLAFLRRARMPVVTTLHTVLLKPDAQQKRVMDELISLSSRVVVMAGRARAMLKDVYGVPDDKVLIIPHGIPDTPLTDPSFYKDQFGVTGRPVMLSFGLLSPNKGIEYVIEALPEITREHPETIYIILGATHPNLLRESGEAYRLMLERMARTLGVENNVKFVNRYVSNDELCEYIGAADIYITPYLSEAQITSGTLSYCYGAGKAIISTPYWHAAELLRDNRGCLVPFRDSGAIARAVLSVLGDKEHLDTMRRNAYLDGRKMIWPEVASAYAQVFAEARANFQKERVEKLATPAQFGEHSHLPPWRFDHLHRLTDHTGILQHATFTIPDYAHGYCTDDNARALLFTVLLEELEECTGELRQLRSAYAAFLQHAYVQDEARFRNFMGFDRKWLEDRGSEDSHGRALWALGAVVGRTRSENLRAWAAPLFEAATPSVSRFTSPRAWAFTILGLHEYLRSFEGDLMAQRRREELSARLFGLWQHNASARWPWFEEVVSYDNPRLSHALILTGRWTERSDMLEAGISSLRWLMEKQKGEDGCFRPVGSNGFWHKGGEPAQHDQQPVEAAAAVSACIEALNATGDEYWRGEANRAFDWFLGENDLNAPVYDPATGGCHDGLHPSRVNENQGAESTLSFLLGLAEMKLLDNVTAAFQKSLPGFKV